MASRSYLINGSEWPSVTTVLSMLDKGEALMQWAVNCAINYIRQNAVDEDWEVVLRLATNNWREAREEAADIGSEIHALIKTYIRHGRDAVGSYRIEVEHGFLAFLEWEKVNQITWLESEKEVFDPAHGYAGTLDAKCLFGAGPFAGRVFVIDFKSSKGFYDGYGEQVSAYRHADSLNAKIAADGCGILRLDKTTGDPEFKDFSDVYDQKLAFFFKLVEAYYLQKNRKLKNNPLTLTGRGVAARGGKKTIADLKAARGAKPAADWGAAPAELPLDKLFGLKAPAAYSFLLRLGWLREGQQFGELAPERVAQIRRSPEKFLTAACAMA
jgi:hypothetical protein